MESDLTLVIDRDKLPPTPSTVPGPTIDMLADIERARRDSQDDVETLVACEGPCSTCPCCAGAHMMSVERWAEWRRLNSSDPEAA